MLKKQANEIIVGLSKPGKMPCKGYSIPAKECKTGSKLRTVAGSVCSSCYACKGNYTRFKNVEIALYKRLDALQNPLWIEAMVKSIGNDDFFRWHDSGDLQSLEHFQKIIAVCLATPKTKHWLPTKEKKILKEFFSGGGKLPKNLTVRLSAYMVDSKPPKFIHGKINFSTVHDKQKPTGKECPAYKNSGQCGDCRQCWDKSILNISYKKH